MSEDGAETPRSEEKEIGMNICADIHNNHQHMHTFSFDTIKL